MTMTFNSLQEEILTYLNRTDSDTQNQVANFISESQADLASESKNLGYVIYVKSNFTKSVPAYPKPSRWRRNLSFNFGTGPQNNTRNQVYLRSYEYIRSFWTDDTQESTPQYYSDYGYNNFLVAPTPDQDYPFELAYLQQITPIDVNNQTNWFTDIEPTLLLYKCLIKATLFLKNDERIAVWQKYVDDRLHFINSLDDQRIIDRGGNIRAN